jgi:hypothetical protein
MLSFFMLTVSEPARCRACPTADCGQCFDSNNLNFFSVTGRIRS